MKNNIFIIDDKLYNKIDPKILLDGGLTDGVFSIQKKISRNKYLIARDRHGCKKLFYSIKNKKDSFVWNVKNYEKLKNKKINIYKLSVFQRLIALSELNFYDKADLEMRNLYSKLERNRSNTKLLLYLI